MRKTNDQQQLMINIVIDEVNVMKVIKLRNARNTGKESCMERWTSDPLVLHNLNLLAELSEVKVVSLTTEHSLSISL